MRWPNADGLREARWSILGGALVLAVVLLALLRFFPGADGHGLARTYAGPTGSGQTKAASSLTVDPSPGCNPCPSGELTWRGTLSIPRGGSYVFFVEQEEAGSSRLLVGNLSVVLFEPGRRVNRQPFAEGLVPITFEHRGPGAVRIFWLPPGRRGEPETIPPSVLWPTPPEQAPAPATTAAFGREGAVGILLGLLALFVGFTFLPKELFDVVPEPEAEPEQRQALRSEKRKASKKARRENSSRAPPAARYWFLFGVVVFAALIPRLAGLNGFGQTWDEDVYFSSGRQLYHHLLHLDVGGQAWRWNPEHPLLAKLIYGGVALASDSYLPVRIISALLSSATAGVILLTAFGLGLPRIAAVSAGLMCAWLPALVAHGRIVGLETPATLLVALALLAATKRCFFVAAIFVGLGASVRVTTGFCLLAVLAAVWLAPKPERPDWRELGQMVLLAVAIPIWLWPRALTRGPFAALTSTLEQLQAGGSTEWFLGKTIAPRFPIYYLPTYLLVTLPVVVTAGLVLAMLWRRRPSATGTGTGIGTVLAFVIAPLGVIMSPLVRDGVRYALPALPGLVLLSVMGWHGLFQAIGRRFAGRASTVTAIGQGGLAAACLLATLSTFPYELDYYNFVAGSAKTIVAKRRFIFGWWGEGVEAAVRYLNTTAPPRSTVSLDVWPNHIVWVRPDLAVVPRERAEFAIVNRFQYRLPEPPVGFEPIFSTTVGGAPLAVVYRHVTELGLR